MSCNVEHTGRSSHGDPLVNVGESVECYVGDAVGFEDGFCVCLSVGLSVGICVGSEVEDTVGLGIG
jgi:hypothetical protein